MYLQYHRHHANKRSETEHAYARSVIIVPLFAQPLLYYHLRKFIPVTELLSSGIYSVSFHDTSPGRLQCGVNTVHNGKEGLHLCPCDFHELVGHGVWTLQPRPGQQFAIQVDGFDDWLEHTVAVKDVDRKRIRELFALVQGLTDVLL